MTRFWPFAPNWRNSVNANYEFRTTTLTSRQKREQRIALRDEPRMTFSFLTTVHRDAYQALVREVTQGATEDWWVMDPTTGVGVSAGVPSGGDTITPLVVMPWMTVGRKVVLSAGSRIELFTIDGVGATLSFEETFTSAWPSWTKINLARRGWLTPSSSMVLPLNNTAEMTVNIEVMPGSDPVEIPEAATAIFNGREVFLKKPNWQETPQDTLEAFREIVDYGKGRIGSFSMADFLPVTRRFTYHGKSRTELESIRQFFLRATGQQGEFYMPTWTEDLSLSASLQAGSREMRVKGAGIYAAYHNDRIRQAIAVHKIDGSWLFQTVAGMRVEGNDTVITSSDPWSEDLTIGGVRSVCWMPVWRLMSDTLSVEWLTDEKGQVVLTSKMLPDEDVTIWDDIFSDQRAYGGEDWSGWGISSDRPGDDAIMHYMSKRLPRKQPSGARITLSSPTGALHLRSRLQPPPRSVLKNWSLDFASTVIERGKTGSNWGQLYMWGEFVESILAGTPRVGIDAEKGDETITLHDNEDAVTFVRAARPGSVAILRTDATLPNYHPDTSRQILYIESVSGLTLNLSRPLEIDAPTENPIGDFPGEATDPSSITLLVGSSLVEDAAAGDTQISLSFVEGIAAGDWVYLSTSEIPNATHNQFVSTVGENLNPDQDFGDILMNEEINRVLAVNGRVLTLAYPIGKNKLLEWGAACVKIDPIENVSVRGGIWEGYEDHGSVEAWQHQYVWARYCVQTEIGFARFDTDGRSLTRRRIGQAVRSDTGWGNLITKNIIAQGGSYTEGQGYGISLRRGERMSFVSFNEIERCRHSVEFWSTSGGCVAEDNTIRNGTSSDLDTHGSWNTGITIRRNHFSNDGAVLSPDLVGLPDAIRVGNNKFWFDENVYCYDNIVENYRGTAFRVVPGSRNVVCDGLKVTNTDRVVGLARNSRHPLLKMENIIVRNVEADRITDRLTEIDNTSDSVHVDGLVLEDWVVGSSGVGTVASAGIQNFRIFWANNVTLRRVRLENIATQTFGYAWWFEDVDGLVFDDCFQQGGERAIRATRTTDISGDIELHDLTATTAHAFRDVTSACSGSLTISYAGFTPVNVGTNVSLTMIQI